MSAKASLALIAVAPAGPPSAFVPANCGIGVSKLAPLLNTDEVMTAMPAW